jgi:hypothetical protein
MHGETLEKATAESYYNLMRYDYPKFFKMDLLCKWAWLGAEMLLKDDEGKYACDGLDKMKTAVVLMTSHGCLEADKKYNATTATIPSPALFVYTLPNIMLGEISIRYGFKGEQMCLVSERFNMDELYFWVNDLLQHRGMDACICGWVDVTNDKKDVCLFWVDKNNRAKFSSVAMADVYNTQLNEA